MASKKKAVKKKAKGKKAKKKGAVKKASTKNKLITMNFKCFPGEARALQKRADQYAGGNLSAWMRHAGQHHKGQAPAEA